MPELPEVETVRRGLLKIAKGRKINAIDVYYGKIITNDVEEFRQALIGQTIEDIDRRGKYLLFRFSNQLTMVSHLRMEGQYFSQSVGAPIDKHTHVVFQFTDGTELCYHDTRKFGRMTLVKTGQEMKVGGLKTIGPEPTPEDFKLDFFKAELKKSRGKIKPFLLNQRHVAGLGNIYVDEVLWMSKINPEQPANTLTAAEIWSLHDNIIKELAMAIKYKGTTVHTFVDAMGDAGGFQERLNAYDRGGEQCPRCGTKMVKIKVAQRGTTFCPYCQPLREVGETKIVGLTGGIATGKSTVSSLLNQAGFPIVDADLVTRQVQRPGSTGLKRLAAAFGPQIIGKDGQLDRQQLGQLVFSDAAARRQLNEIMQPLIRKAIWQAVDDFRRTGVATVILDVPLLFEQHYDRDCDYVVVVAVEPATELQRLMARNHYSKKMAQARIAAQMPLEKKIQRADLVIDNNGSLAETRRQVHQLVEDLRNPR